jgi:hypothetical protein
MVIGRYLNLTGLKLPSLARYRRRHLHRRDELTPPVPREQLISVTNAEAQEWICTGHLMMQLLSASSTDVMEQIIIWRRLDKWKGRTESQWKNYHALIKHGWGEEETITGDDILSYNFDVMKPLLNEFGIPTYDHSKWTIGTLEQFQAYTDSKGVVQEVSHSFNIS